MRKSTIMSMAIFNSKTVKLPEGTTNKQLDLECFRLFLQKGAIGTMFLIGIA